MEDRPSPDEIRKLAAELDNAIESRNAEAVISSFSEDCEIEFLGIKLTGKEGVRKWLHWVYGHLAQIKFEPVTIMVDRNTFFEEFVLKGKLHDGSEVRSRQAEVLVYKNHRVKSLRLYFDRLDFAGSVTRGFISKAVVRHMVRKSLGGLKSSHYREP